EGEKGKGIKEGEEGTEGNGEEERGMVRKEGVEGRRRGGRGRGRKGGKGPEGEGSDTETETETEGLSQSDATPENKQIEEEQGRGSALLSPRESARAEGGAELRKRRSLGERSEGETSTDSEWDKVEEVGDVGR
ncbi:MAG: hypothetical protein Q9164_006006, partial [Protoblastenia rupestris]